MPAIVWKGHLTFGLVSIPVKLFRAARRERVRLHYVHRPQAAEPASDVASDVPFVDRAGLAALRASMGRSQQPEPEPAPPVPPRAEPASEPVSIPGPVSRVRQTLVAPGDEQPIRRADLSRGYEV